jgi:hypothetical protein
MRRAALDTLALALLVWLLWALVAVLDDGPAVEPGGELSAISGGVR